MSSIRSLPTPHLHPNLTRTSSGVYPFSVAQPTAVVITSSTLCSTEFNLVVLTGRRQFNLPLAP
ncbi:hypothetical protein CERSUDRAFT_101285 [Gelatoporia subvermispora B]|uniref:Uncharacterized protein n=1 Tax=Ceriporiopsis subvermispora (strain B) TaxID=914234 RepID=M2P5L7_CERS8|nr:hypothetical protein CERSUDRAFT_101285 [Gelatoporia subvermispora B]